MKLDRPFAAADPDAAARADLARHRAVATGLLLLMAAITIGSLFLAPTYPAFLLQAAAKAGLIGGIADWFAVTALFRHPLGLPIPHTAIIPMQKARLGQALGRFVANNVFTSADVGRTLDQLDAPGLLRGMLADPATSGPLAIALARWLPRLLASAEDGRARRLLGRLIPRLLGSSSAGMVVARALRGMVEGGRHQEVFGFVLEQLRAGLAAQDEALRHTIEDRVREQGGKLVGWAIGASVAKRVLSAVNTEFDKMKPHDSELRIAFDEWARREIARIEDDPGRAAEIGQAIRALVTHDAIQLWLADIWERLRTTLARDAANPRGRTVTLLQGALADLGRMLQDDAATRARVKAAVSGIVTHSLPVLRARLTEFIARVVAGWDTATITDRLELRIGRDLQYVRMNGTIVGFLAGGALFALLHAVFPATRF